MDKQHFPDRPGAVMITPHYAVGLSALSRLLQCSKLVLGRWLAAPVSHQDIYSLDGSDTPPPPDPATHTVSYDRQKHLHITTGLLGREPPLRTPVLSGPQGSLGLSDHLPSALRTKHLSELTTKRGLQVTLVLGVSVTPNSSEHALRARVRKEAFHDLTL